VNLKTGKPYLQRGYAPSYERAEYLFKTATKPLDPQRRGHTLHQLRHSALTHAAKRGRSAPELQAKSRHASLATLGHYVRLGADTAERITREDDPANRRR
jgi:integrase